MCIYALVLYAYVNACSLWVHMTIEDRRWSLSGVSSQLPLMRIGDQT